MQSLLKIVTECIDKFALNEKIERLAAIIGGEAVILHGIPRTTIDVDVLLFFGDEKNHTGHMAQRLVLCLRKEMGDRFDVKMFEASKDPFDPLRHDLIIITDLKNKYKKLDILIANYTWELEGLRTMDNPYGGKLQVFPKPYLAGLKLTAGGIQDEEDIRNLFVVMDDSEKEKTWELARLIRRDKNLSKILSARKRPEKIDQNSDLEKFKIGVVQVDNYKPQNE